MLIYNNSKLVKLDSRHEVLAVEFTPNGLAITLLDGRKEFFNYATRNGLLSAYGSLLNTLKQDIEGDININGDEQEFCVRAANGNVEIY